MAFGVAGGKHLLKTRGDLVLRVEMLPCPMGQPRLDNQRVGQLIPDGQQLLPGLGEPESRGRNAGGNCMAVRRQLVEQVQLGRDIGFVEPEAPQEFVAVAGQDLNARVAACQHHRPFQVVGFRAEQESRPGAFEAAAGVQRNPSAGPGVPGAAPMARSARTRSRRRARLRVTDRALAPPPRMIAGGKRAGTELVPAGRVFPKVASPWLSWATAFTV